MISNINTYGPASKPCAHILGTSAMPIDRSKTDRGITVGATQERGAAAGFAGAVVGTPEGSPAWRPPIC